MTSLWRPISVGAIEPVGMTNASASNVRNKNAKTKAMATDSISSRIAAGEGRWLLPPEDGSADSLSDLPGDADEERGFAPGDLDLAILKQNQGMIANQ